MIRLKRLYVNTASSFCMLVIRKFLLSTEYTEEHGLFETETWQRGTVLLRYLTHEKTD